MTETIKDETEKMLEMGNMEPSQSPYISPVVLVKKSDQSIRFCIDFRNLNKLTVFDAEPIPNPDVIFSKLANCIYFTKIDMSKGYWQIRLTEDSKEKTAFGTPYWLSQFGKLPFGLVTAPANFSRMMRLLLRGLKDIDNFIDDILEHTVDSSDHIVGLRELLQRLRQAGLTARPSKCMKHQLVDLYHLCSQYDHDQKMTPPRVSTSCAFCQHYKWTLFHAKLYNETAD